MSKGSSGRFSGTSGANADNNAGHTGAIHLPRHASQLEHLFSDRKGHLIDTPMRRLWILDLVNDPANYRGTDKYGVDWYIGTRPGAGQLWARVHGDAVSDCGQNMKPRNWNDSTGLNDNTPRGALVMDSKAAYNRMFKALDDLWDETRDEGLGEFLSGANPTLFDDAGSADPAVFVEYSDAFNRRFDERGCSGPEARAFTKKWLESEGHAAIATDLALRTSPAIWEE